MKERKKETSIKKEKNKEIEKERRKETLSKKERKVKGK